jgi:hypothetical protein
VALHDGVECCGVATDLVAFELGHLLGGRVHGSGLVQRLVVSELRGG